MIDERVPTDVRFVSKVTMPGKVTWLMSDQLLLEYAADKGGYVQVKNGVRVLMVPKDEK